MHLFRCITPTRCSESLWLIENKERMEFRIETKINFYYHDYHEPLPDRLPKNMDHEHGHRDYEDIPYVVEYDPMIEFIKFYIPWKSVYGAMIFLSSFMTIFSTSYYNIEVIYRVLRHRENRKSDYFDMAVTGY